MQEHTDFYRVLTDGSVLVRTGTGEQRLAMVAPGIVRITCPASAADRRAEATQGFVQRPQAWEIQREPDGVLLSGDGVTLRLHPDGRIDFCTPQGTPLCRDYTENPKRAEGLPPQQQELAALEGHAVNAQDGEHAWRILKRLEGDECFYGLGDKTGFLNKRGYEYIMWNTDNPRTQMETREFRAMYKSIPFLIVLRQQGVFGLFWDNPHRMTVDLGFADEGCYRMEADVGPLDYYYIAGESMAQVVEGYARLTGRTPLPPMWTLGYHQSRWSYASAAEVEEIAQKLREYDLPCDSIHLDIDYMDAFKVFTWNGERFPHPQKLLAGLREKGFKPVTIVDPGVKKEEGYPVYDEGMREGYFLRDADATVYENTVWPGVSVFPDFSNPKTRRWWQGLVEEWLEQGIKGIWNDMNEPASFNGPLPGDLLFDNEGEGATHDDMHNLYGHLMAKATAAAFEARGERPYVITRACYSGSQKYTTAWTGDNQSVWAHLQMSIPQLCNLGLSGMPVVGCDVGGFGENVTPELLVRWVQAGCLTPFFRNHCAGGCRRQELWQFGEPVLSICRKYLKLRYRLLPYLYDRLWEASQTGLPVMRPLVLHYAQDEQTHDLNDEFLVGESLLAAPVVEQGKRMKMVYLPQGDWIDFWTGEIHTGGRTILRQAELDLCPLYVKSGSILPLYPQGMSHVGETLPDTLVLELYGSGGVYRHYQDAGEGLDYRQGMYNLYRMEWEGDRLTISLEHAGYAAPYRRFEIHRGKECLSVQPEGFPCTVHLGTACDEG